jgi:ubiquinone/menaquinone biosynthesis C-methylase UbiE
MNSMTMNRDTNPLDFTGERFTPECQREIWYEHLHRYALATRWCKGLRTLDAACGEGYGSALLATSASSVEGIDISVEAVQHAKKRYGEIANLNIQVADCTKLPFADNEFDRIVSFETLEHLEQQDELLAEFRRVLKPDGFLALSSPDKAIYSDKYNTENEFHVKELYRNELESLISRHFPAYRLLGQKLAFNSMIWSMDDVNKVEFDQWTDGKHQRPKNINQPAMYFIALCAGSDLQLPDSNGQLWLFDDLEESVYQHYQGEIGRNMAAGGVIASLEQEIDTLKARLSEVDSRSWWQRLFAKS